MEDGEILNLAKVVRKELLSFAQRNKDINPKNLEGACAIASFVLHKLLTKNGMKARVKCGLFYPKGINKHVKTYDDGPYTHCWLVVDIDGVSYILDVTASQFNKHKNTDVILIKESDGSNHWASAKDVITDDWNSVRKYFYSWPTGQQPNYDVVFPIVVMSERLNLS